LSESGDNNAYQDEIDRVLVEGKYLAALVRHLRLKNMPDVELAKRSLQRAIQVQQDVAVAECLIMAMEDKSKDLPKSELFEPAIEYLNIRQQYWWVRSAWFVRKASSFFASLSSDQLSLLMPAIVHAAKVDYQVEQILTQIARRYP